MNFSNLASGIRFKATGVVPGIAAKRSKSAGGAQILIARGYIEAVYLVIFSIYN